MQLVICLFTLIIYAVDCCKGHVHDFKILKDSKLQIHKDIKKLADAGYQGIIKLYSNSHTPVKNTKNKPLTKADKGYNGAVLVHKGPELLQVKSLVKMGRLPMK